MKARHENCKFSKLQRKPCLCTKKKKKKKKTSTPTQRSGKKTQILTNPDPHPQEGKYSVFGWANIPGVIPFHFGIIWMFLNFISGIYRTISKEIVLTQETIS
jgi:hypothetical protein